MYLKNALLLAGSMTSAVMAAVLNVDTECGAPDPSEELMSVAREMAAMEAEALNSFSTESLATIEVPVYAHVVASSRTDAGYISVSFVPLAASALSLASTTDN
jgi:hypothetical protein